jgi:hypothetical protein
MTRYSFLQEIPHGILDAANCILNLACGSLGLPISFQLGIADRLADDFFYRAVDLFRDSRDPILIHYFYSLNNKQALSQRFGSVLIFYDKATGIPGSSGKMPPAGPLKRGPMDIILIIIILILLFGGGFGYSRYGYRGGIGIGGILLIVLILYLVLGRGRI